MIIEITREDINKAKEAAQKFYALEVTTYARAETCPLAFALCRHFPGWKFWVGAVWISAKREGAKEVAKLKALPTETMKFIELTDKRKDRIAPKSVEVFLPEGIGDL